MPQAKFGAAMQNGRSECAASQPANFWQALKICGPASRERPVAAAPERADKEMQNAHFAPFSTCCDLMWHSIPLFACYMSDAWHTLFFPCGSCLLKLLLRDAIDE
jgi:hypothetical protein